jgi:alpha-L-rhamnosidase
MCPAASTLVMPGLHRGSPRASPGSRQDSAKPGYQSFLIQPVPGGKLTFAETTTESPYGPIASRWEKNRGVLKLIVTIPPNSTATVHIPTTNAASLTEGGKSLRETDGVTPLEVEGGHAVLKVESGRYEFLSEIR